MPIKHGVYISEQNTAVSTPVVAECAIPFVIGAAPVQAASKPAAVETPVLCTSWGEFVEKFGYSDNWEKYNLCEFAYSHFKLYACQPVIFCNLLNLGGSNPMTESVSASEKAVVNHCVNLPIEAIDDENLVVTTTDDSPATLVKGTDYDVFYADEYLVIELRASSTHYAETALSVAYKQATPDSVTAVLVASKMDCIDLCMSSVGVVPDIICAPGFSQVSAVAAVLTTKAESINGVFSAKAIIDVDTSTVTEFSGVSAWKATNNVTDENQILCWPMVKLGDKKFHMSTALAGLMATVDISNGCPYESPSNKSFKMDGLCLESGAAVVQTKAQADTLNGYGCVTALNFLASGWVCWGNYTACYPASTDVKDYFIPVSRMFDWIGNSLVKTFWSKLDKPMNRRLIDTILDSVNIWLNGLVGRGYLLGARAEMLDSENSLTDLMAGIIKIHIYMTPPSPAQEIDFTLEYDTNYVTSALSE